MENIIFDYGGVIFDIEHSFMAQAFADLGVPDLSDQFSLAAQSDLFDAFETGAIEPKAFREGIRKMGKADLSDQQIDDAWNAMLIGIPMGNLELLEQAKKKYRTFLLSNNNILHYNRITEYLRTDFEIDSIASYFERAYYSHELGMRKPNRNIFEYVLDAHGLDPVETLFIDDSPQHIETAEKLGIQTRLVRKGEPLKSVLVPYL